MPRGGISATTEKTGMARFAEFLINHWILSGLWLALFAALVVYLRAKAAKSVSPQQAALLVNRENGVFVDVRERKDYERGHIVDAIHIPAAKLQERIVELDKYKSVPVIVVCAMGQHAGDVVKQLEARGFSQACKMSGGMAEWAGQNLPLVK
jgi:rhodanese-related sulfurtransferase